MAEGPVNPQAHWDGVYAQRDPRELSWFAPAPEISLALIEQAGVARDGAIVDTGGGTSGLAAALLADGYTEHHGRRHLRRLAPRSCDDPRR
jgi:hypothetical protein